MDPNTACSASKLYGIAAAPELFVGIFYQPFLYSGLRNLNINFCAYALIYFDLCLISAKLFDILNTDLALVYLQPKIGFDYGTNVLSCN